MTEHDTWAHLTDDELLATVTVTEVLNGRSEPGTYAAAVWARHPQLSEIANLRQLRESQHHHFDGVDIFDVEGPAWRYPDTQALTQALEARVAWIVDGDDTGLRQRPTMTADQAAHHCGVARSTWESYVARDQAPTALGFDFHTGARVWDADVVTAWQSARTDEVRIHGRELSGA